MYLKKNKLSPKCLPGGASRQGTIPGSSEASTRKLVPFWARESFVSILTCSRDNTYIYMFVYITFEDDIVIWCQHSTKEGPSTSCRGSPYSSLCPGFALSILDTSFPAQKFCSPLCLSLQEPSDPLCLDSCFPSLSSQSTNCPELPWDPWASVRHKPAFSMSTWQKPSGICADHLGFLYFVLCVLLQLRYALLLQVSTEVTLLWNAVFGLLQPLRLHTTKQPDMPVSVWPHGVTLAPLF